MNYIFTKLLNFLISNEKENSIYLRLYNPKGVYPHYQFQKIDIGESKLETGYF